MTSCHHFFPFLFSTWLVLLVFFWVPSIILTVEESTKEDDYDVFPAENMAAGQQKENRVDNSTHEDSLKVLDNDDDMSWMFDCWVEFHDKTYVDSEERRYRQAVFDQNVAKWHILNQMEGGARYGPHNEPYADLTADEFIQVVANCYKEEEEEEITVLKKKKKKKNDNNIGKGTSAVEEKTGSTASMSTTRHHLRHLHYSGTTAMPYTRKDTGSSTSSTTWMRIDWRDHLGKSYVTPVKDQGPHGTCWSFGAAENLEGLGVRQGYDLTAISEQEFISCCPDCQGRSTDITFQWLIDNTNGHPALEEFYPYEGNVTKCHKVDAPRSPLQLHSWGRIVDSEDGTGRIIEQGLFERGPMGLGVDASCFHGYRSGVVRNCSSRGINHAVLLVAAGTDIYWNSNQINDEDNSLHSSLPTIVDFFTIKNSWSTGWGEAGYVRIEQGKDWWGALNVIYTE